MEKTAIHGRWVKGPGEALFKVLATALGNLPFIAEDLGVITPEVEALREQFGFPGMKILQFAFGSGPHNPYLPHNHRRRSVVYTGTHDNDTTAGWFASLGGKEHRAVLNYVRCSAADMPWELVRTALASVAEIAVMPLQDILGLGSEGRMNIPGTARGNWSWRYQATALDDILARKLCEAVEFFGRLPGELVC